MGDIRERERREKVEEQKLYSATADDDENINETKVLRDEENDNKKVKLAVNQPTEEQKNRHATKLRELIEQYANFGPPPKRIKANAKAVPPDYICQACKNELNPYIGPHWIYNCPMKQTKKGCNQLTKRLRGLNAPSDHKVFVSGLPFECTEIDVKQYFNESINSDQQVNLVRCKLIKFEDSKRCKGQAILTFGSSEGAEMALKLNNSTWRQINKTGTKNK